jgi:Zn-finger nucleic acid-binding protein
MCCPKCGGKMAEKRFESVMIDECTACGGIYFDEGELDILIKHEKGSGGVLGRLFGR